MSRLVWFLAPFILIFVFGCLALVGIHTLSNPIETSATSVSIEEIEDGKRPSAQWISLTGEAIVDTDQLTIEERRGRRGRRTTIYYAPIVSRSVKEEWAKSADQDEPTSFARCRLIGILPKEVAEGTKPGVTITGVLKKPSSIGENGRGAIAAGATNFDWNSMLVLEVGERPIQTWEAIGMSIGGVLGVLASVYWLIRRWSPKRSPSSPENE